MLAAAGVSTGTPDAEKGVLTFECLLELSQAAMYGIDQLIESHQLLT
jgi:hypothetical protein